MENKKVFLILSKTIDFLHKLCYNNNCQEGMQYFNHERGKNHERKERKKETHF